MSTINTTNLKNPSSGSNNVVLNADGTSTLTPSNIIKSGTAVASTSGTSIDFTGLPSWVKRVTVMLAGVSTNGTSLPQVQLGAGSVTTSGYLSYAGLVGTSSAAQSSTTGMAIGGAVATNLFYCAMSIVNVSGNTWIAALSGGLNSSGTSYGVSGGGSVTLSGTLDRVRITTVGGTDTFDAGTINILYEG
jgi:hypothetical protein